MIQLPKDHPYYNGRECTSCGQFKQANEFSRERDSRSLTGIALRSKCRTCNELKKYKSFIKRAYGITYEDYEKILEKQNGQCAICKSKVSSKRTDRLFVDHCHNTLKIRGLLCSSCNHGLGQFKDNPNLLKRAISYLQSDKD